MSTAATAPGGVRPGDIAVTAVAPAAWGLTYLATSEFLPPDRPLLAGALRALPAGLMLAALAPQRPHGQWWWKASVLGTLNIGVFFALLFAAAYRLPGGVAATLGAIQPLIAAGLATTLLGERLRPATLAAAVVGMTGVALLVLRPNAHLDPIGVAAGLTAAASMATGVVLTKRWGRPVPLTTFTSWQLIIGGLLLAPIAILTEGIPSALTPRNIVGYAWLSTGGTALAYYVWFRGIAKLPISQVSLLGLASPIVATLAGWIVLNQQLTNTQLVGGVLVLAALWIGQRPAHPKPGPPETRRPIVSHSHPAAARS